MKGSGRQRHTAKLSYGKRENKATQQKPRKPLTVSVAPTLQKSSDGTAPPCSDMAVSWYEGMALVPKEGAYSHKRLQRC